MVSQEKYDVQTKGAAAIRSSELWGKTEQQWRSINESPSREKRKTTRPFKENSRVEKLTRGGPQCIS